MLLSGEEASFPFFILQISPFCRGLVEVTKDTWKPLSSSPIYIPTYLLSFLTDLTNRFTTTITLLLAYFCVSDPLPYIHTVAH